MLAQNVQTQGTAGIFSVFSGKMTATAASQNNTFEKLFETTTQKAETVEKTEPAVQKQTATEVKKPETGGTSLKDASQTENTPDGLQNQKTAKAEVTVTDTEYAEKAASLLNQVVEAVKDVLELTDEQLEAMLEQLGMSQAELMDPAKLQDLYLFANQETDAAVLLTDATMFDELQQLTQTVENLVEESGIPAKELLAKLEGDPEFAEFLSNMQEALKQSDTEEPTDKNQMDTEDAAETTTVAEKTTETKTLDIEFKTETESSEANQSALKSTKEESTSTETPAEQFLTQLQNVADKAGVESRTGNLQAELREIANQILEQVRVVVKPEMTSLEIQLTPEHLGKVNLTVTEQDGVMTAKFLTENQLSKEAIERNLVQFKEMLQEQGLKVDSIEVAVSEFGFNKDSQAEQGSQEDQQKGKHRFVMDEADETRVAADQLGIHFLEGGESTVNYMA